MIAIAAIVQVAFGASVGSALYFYAGVTAARLGGRAPRHRRDRGGGDRGHAGDRRRGRRLERRRRPRRDRRHDLADAVRAGPARPRQPRAAGGAPGARRPRRGRGAGADRARPPRHPRPQPVGHRAQERARAPRPARRPGRGPPPRSATSSASPARPWPRCARRSAATASRRSRWSSPGRATALAAAGIEGDVEPAPEGLPREVDAVLGWAVREGVTNVLRHSDAARARDPRHRRRPASAPSRSRTTGRGSTGVAGAAPDGARAGTGLDGPPRARAPRSAAAVEAGPLAGRRLPAAGLACRVAPAGARRVTRVLLAEDQAMVRGALAALLALEPDLEVVAEVGRGDEVVPRALETRPGRGAAGHRDARARRARGRRPAPDRRPGLPRGDPHDVRPARVPAASHGGRRDRVPAQGRARPPSSPTRSGGWRAASASWTRRWPWPR